MDIRKQAAELANSGYLREVFSGRKISEIVFNGHGITGASILSAVVYLKMQTKERNVNIIDGLTIQQLMHITNLFGGKAYTSGFNFSFAYDLGGVGNAVNMEDAEEVELSISWDPTGVTAGELEIGTTAHDSDVESFIPYFGAQTMDLTDGALKSAPLRSENPSLCVIIDGSGVVDTVEVQKSNSNTIATRGLYLGNTRSNYKLEDDAEDDVLVIFDHTNIVSAVAENPVLKVRGSGTGTITILTFGFYLDADRIEKKQDSHNLDVVNQIEKIETRFPARALALKTMGAMSA